MSKPKRGQKTDKNRQKSPRKEKLSCRKSHFFCGKATKTPADVPPKAEKRKQKPALIEAEYITLLFSNEQPYWV